MGWIKVIDYKIIIEWRSNKERQREAGWGFAHRREYKLVGGEGGVDRLSILLFFIIEWFSLGKQLPLFFCLSIPLLLDLLLCLLQLSTLSSNTSTLASNCAVVIFQNGPIVATTIKSSNKRINKPKNWVIQIIFI